LVRTNAHEAHRSAADMLADLLEWIGERDALRHDEAARVPILPSASSIFEWG
jgi:hypothetical protein